MKITNIYLSGLFWTLLPFCSSAQNNPFWDVPTGKQVDSLKKVLAGSKNDTRQYVSQQADRNAYIRNLTDLLL